MPDKPLTASPLASDEADGLARSQDGGDRALADLPAASAPAFGPLLPARQAWMPPRAMARMQDKDDGKDEGGSGTGLATRTKTKTKKPSLYRVLLLNDDFTPMEFVVHVHNHGVGECGVYTFEVAETKVTQVMDFARKHQHPLQCVMEKK